MGRPRTIFSKIADEIGISRTSVRRALAEAGMSESEAEKDFERAVEIVEAINDKDKTLGHNAMGRGGEGSSSTYAEAKAQAELHRAEKLRLQNAKLAGQLIDREAVTQTGIHIIASVRTGLLALGHRISAKVAGKADPQEISRIVESEVRDVLGALADPDKFFAALEADALT